MSVSQFFSLAILLLVLGLSPGQLQATNPDVGGDFTLTDHLNQPYSLAQQRGKVVVMFFGFTHCPAICPDSLIKMAKVLAALDAHADELSAVFISVDPERDTVEKLAQYVPFFSPQLRGLTGDRAQIDAVTQAYRAHYKLQKQRATDTNYTVDHSADIYVLDRAGQVDTIVPYGLPTQHVLRVISGVLDKKRPSDNPVKAAQQLPSKLESAKDVPPILKARRKQTEPLKLALYDLTGKLHTLSAYKGQTVLINFWASWCPPCRAELPALNNAWAALRAEGVAMLAVNVGEQKRAVKAFLQDYPIDFPVLLDEQSSSLRRWHIKGMPTTVILNPQGEVAHHIVGEKVWDAPEVLAQIRAVYTRRSGDANE